jgi:hypothetical protein
VDGRFVPKWVERSVKRYVERSGLSIRMRLTDAPLRRDLPPKTRRELERALNSPLGAGMKKRAELIWIVFSECPVHPKTHRVECRGPNTGR